MWARGGVGGAAAAFGAEEGCPGVEGWGVGWCWVGEEGDFDVFLLVEGFGGCW